MSTPVPLSRILNPDEFPDKAIVMSVTGKLVSLYDANKGEGADGEYEFQNGVLEQGGKKIKIVFSKCSQPKTARGKEITILSAKTDKFGWQGVKVEDRSWNKDGEDHHERQLKVTPTAEISYGGASSTGTPTGGSQTGGGQAGSGQAAPQQRKATGHPLPILKDNLALHGAIASLVNEKYGAMPAEFQQSAIATLFIEAARQGLCWDFEKAAAAPLPKKYPPVPTDPKEWKNCVLSKGKNEGKTLAEISDADLLAMFSYYDEKQDNSALAECVYEAARSRDVLPKPKPPEKTPEDAALDPAPPEDDIPF